MDPSKTQTPLSSIDPSKTQTPLSSIDPSRTQTPLNSIDPSKTQTPLGSMYSQDPHSSHQPPPPSYDFPHTSSAAPVSGSTTPFSPAAVNAHAHEAPVPIMRSASQYAPEYVADHSSQHAPEAVPQRTPSHGSSRYLHAVPIHLLARSPAPVDCPMCNKRGATVCTTKSGNFTHLWGALTCACTCLGCIPYMVSGLKDVRHNCESCGALLAIWHRSGGGTDVVAYAMK